MHVWLRIVNINFSGINKILHETRICLSFLTIVI